MQVFERPAPHGFLAIREVRRAEDDGFAEEGFGLIGNVIENRIAAGRLPHQRDLPGITTKEMDVAADPLQGTPLVLYAQVDGSLLGKVEKSESSQPIGDINHHDVVLQG